MTLYFHNANNERVLLGEYNRKGVFEAIQKFLDDHLFKSYYTRVWRKDDEVWLDVGSWSEFFVVVDKDREWDKE